MKELEYPFDADYIMTNRKKLRRQLMQTDKTGSFRSVRIAVLGGSTIGSIRQVLELFLLNYGIKPDFYESGYNQYYKEAMFQNEELEGFAPDIIYICTSVHNIQKFPGLIDSREEVEHLLNAEAERYFQMWEQLARTYRCAIIQNNFELPCFRLLGNRDAYDIHGAVNFVTRLNMEFYQYAQTHEQFYICDINYISAEYGLKKWSDFRYWYMYKYALAVSAVPYLSFHVANIIKSMLGKNKKGMVCDLDNTLWGGVIGEDGTENIVLGTEEPEGQAYLDFQKYIKAYKERGIVLAINSKNDMENAMAGLKHPDSVLNADDFVCIKANWDSKDENFRQIAEELSLLPESLVFLDDNPAEREIVTSRLAGVQAPELADVAHYIEIMDGSGFFEATSLSEDDLNRAAMYQENRKRLREKAAFTDYGAYLQSLEMKAVIKPFEPVYISRIAQLTNKSNQFNLTTRRYTQAETEEISKNPEYITLYGKLQDKFGDNGVVSLIIGHIVGNQCQIDLWLMSCRVLKRDMELAMMDALVSVCMERKICTLTGCYLPTAKNHMVADFYEKMGFMRIKELDHGGSGWKLDITKNYRNKNKYILVEDENGEKRNPENFK